MTLSVGLAKIQNDPKASPMTRKALGALSNPRLLVLDEGLTINNDGRFVLRLASDGGLSEDANGLAIALNPDGGLIVDANGLAVAELEDITCHTLTVNTTATVATTLTAGAVVSEGAVSGVSATFSGAGAFASVTATGAMSAGNAVIAGSITGASIAVTGAVTGATGSFSGQLSAASAVIAGQLVVGTFAPASISTGAIVCTSILCSGSLSAGSFNPSSITTGLITCTDITAGVGQVVGGGLRIGGGTTMVRLRSYFYTVTVPATAGPHDFTLYAPGAIFEDGALATLIARDFWWGRIDAWSCVCESNDFVTLRIACTSGTASTLGFRVVIFGFL